MGKYVVDPSEGRRAIPAGEYMVVVKYAQDKAPRVGTNRYLEVGMEILEGEFKGEVIIDRFFPENERARGRFVRFLTAVGLVDPGTKGAVEVDTNDIVGTTLVVRGEPEVFRGFEAFRPASFYPCQAPNSAEKASEGPVQEKPVSAAPAVAKPPVRPVPRRTI